MPVSKDFFVRNRKNFFFLCLIIILSYVFFFHALGAYSLKEPDEGRYAEIPREMIETGDYVVPHLNYVRYFYKPPLFYWMVALSYKLFGISEWSFRATNAFFAFLSVLFMYFFARKWFNELVALLCCIILTSSLGFFFMARIVTLDMCFSFLLSASLLCFYDYYRNRSLLCLYLFYAFMGFATLAKGPAAVVLLGGTIPIFLATVRNVSFLKELKLIKGIALYASIVLPWIIAISLREKEFLHFFFVEEHLLRFTTTQHKRSGPLYYFIPVLFGGMFPWSFFIPRSIMTLWKEKELRIFIIWSAVLFGFFTVSGSKLPPYILPIFPALSLVIGYFFYLNRTRFAGRNREIVLYVLVVGAFSLVALLRVHGPFLELISRLSGNAREIAGELKYFALSISVLSVGVVYLLSLKIFNRYVSIFIILTTYSLSFACVLMGFHVDTIDRFKTSKELAAAINQKKGTFDYLVSYDCYQQVIPFYTQSRLILADHAGELKMGSKYEDAKYYFISESEFMQLLSSEKKVLFVAEHKALNHVRSKTAATIEKLRCQGEICVFTNYR